MNKIKPSSLLMYPIVPAAGEYTIYFFLNDKIKYLIYSSLVRFAIEIVKKTPY